MLEDNGTAQADAAPFSARMRARFSKLLSTPEAVVFTVYAGLVAFMTYPAITLTSKVYGQAGDPTGTLWSLWWTKFAFARHIASNPISWISVPYGRRMSFYDRDILTTLTMKGMAIATTETIAYNVFLLISFFLAAVVMYLLVRRLTGSRAAAAVAGALFAFSPYMLMQGKEHIGLVIIAWLPLVFYLLIRGWRERSAGLLLLSGATFVVMTGFNYHLGLIGGVMAAVFVLTAWLLSRPWRELTSRGNIVSGVAVAVALLACVAVIYTRRGTLGKDMTGMFLYSARPWDYLLPHAEGAAFGWASKGFLTSHLHGGFLSESSLFLGFVPLALAFYGVYAVFRKGKAGEAAERSGDEEGSPESLEVLPDRHICVALSVTAAVCFLFSMPPTWKVAGLTLRLPAYYAHALVPEVRAYARFGAGAFFCLAVLAGYGVAALVRKKAFSGHKVLAVVVITFLVLLEYSIVPPFHSLDTAATTDYYEWLKKRPAASVVAMYPFFHADDFMSYGYYFDQRHHEKKLVNGCEPGTEAEKTRQVALDLDNPDTAKILKRLGAEYILAVPSLYAQGNHINYVKPFGYDVLEAPPGLERVREFGDCVVYRNRASRCEVLSLFIEGTHQAVLAPDGRAWHPGDEKMIIDVRSFLDHPATCDITFQASTVKGSGSLRFSMGAAGGGGSIATWQSGFTIPDVSLIPGSNLLEIVTRAPVSEVVDVPGATTVPARVLVSDITVKLK